MDVIVKKIKEIAPEDAFRRAAAEAARRAAAEAARLHRGGGKGRTRKGKFIQGGGAKAEEIRILGKALWICKKALPQLIMVSIEYIQQILLLFILEFPRNMRSIQGGHTPFQMRERILHQGMNDGWRLHPEEARVAATFAYVTKYTDHWVEEEGEDYKWAQGLVQKRMGGGGGWEKRWVKGNVLPQMFDIVLPDMFEIMFQDFLQKTRGQAPSYEKLRQVLARLLIDPFSSQEIKPLIMNLIIVFYENLGKYTIVENLGEPVGLKVNEEEKIHATILHFLNKTLTQEHPNIDNTLREHNQFVRDRICEPNFADIATPEPLENAFGHFFEMEFEELFPLFSMSHAGAGNEDESLLGAGLSTIHSDGGGDDSYERTRRSASRSRSRDEQRHGRRRSRSRSRSHLRPQEESIALRQEVRKRYASPFTTDSPQDIRGLSFSQSQQRGFSQSQQRGFSQSQQRSPGPSMSLRQEVIKGRGSRKPDFMRGLFRGSGKGQRGGAKLTAKQKAKDLLNQIDVTNRWLEAFERKFDEWATHTQTKDFKTYFINPGKMGASRKGDKPFKSHYERADFYKLMNVTDIRRLMETPCADIDKKERKGNFHLLGNWKPRFGRIKNNSGDLPTIRREAQLFVDEVKRRRDEVDAKHRAAVLDAAVAPRLRADNVQGVFADRIHRKIAETVLTLLGLITDARPAIASPKATRLMPNYEPLRVMIVNLISMVNNGTPSPSELDNRVWNSIALTSAPPGTLTNDVYKKKGKRIRFQGRKDVEDFANILKRWADDNPNFNRVCSVNAVAKMGGTNSVLSRGGNIFCSLGNILDMGSPVGGFGQCNVNNANDRGIEVGNERFLLRGGENVWEYNGTYAGPPAPGNITPAMRKQHQLQITFNSGDGAVNTRTIRPSVNVIIQNSKDLILNNVYYTHALPALVTEARRQWAASGGGHDPDMIILINQVFDADVGTRIMIEFLTKVLRKSLGDIVQELNGIGKHGIYTNNYSVTANKRIREHRGGEDAKRITFCCDKPSATRMGFLHTHLPHANKNQNAIVGFWGPNYAHFWGPSIVAQITKLRAAAKDPAWGGSRKKRRRRRTKKRIKRGRTRKKIKRRKKTRRN